ncbi:class I SAM-dependent methyltransferase [Aquabacterium parvum]|uniref:class I SAM-dependent methyltransferase n=1 Tax=Aquabacterium parvum TaxID=70584 RepID=UPI00071902BC|nr:class I SAM-dependent methyltransferase [Aquabacterium parvum]
MSAPRMVMHMLLDRLTPRERARQPEPDLVMDEPTQVLAFASSGADNGPLMPIYLYLAMQASCTIRRGGRVLDLACGPCNQLSLLARLHPETEFIGLDLSETMLHQARHTLDQQGVRNVQLIQGDMRMLEGFDDASFDGVFSTLSLHHLPTVEDLRQATRSASRVLRADGGVFLADFGRLRRQATLDFLVHDRESEQSPLFTQDYMNSLKAAFSLRELEQATSSLGRNVLTHVTALAPFMVILRRRISDETSRARTMNAIRQAFHAMSDSHQRDLLALANWFQAAGLPLPMSLRR